MSEGKLAREQKTIENMVRIFCTERHRHIGSLCEECNSLLEYSVLRLKKCTFGTRKPICSRCELHCYNREMRNKVKEVMRYAGRRMIMLHPLLTLRHIMDSFK